MSAISEVCLACGFCCDGTLFDKTVCGPRDTRESIVAIGLTPIETRKGKTAFRQPCPHFSGACAVYDSRPGTCESFRCRLLKSVREQKYTIAEAHRIVRDTKAMRDAVLPELDALCAAAGAAGASGPERGSLLARCRAAIRLAFLPEAAKLRETGGRPLLNALHLASQLTNEFLPEPRAKNQG